MYPTSQVCAVCRPALSSVASNSARLLQHKTLIAGRVAVVSGFNSGIGLETTRTLLDHGCEVIGISRNEERAWQAVKDLREEFPGATISYKV